MTAVGSGQSEAVAFIGIGTMGHPMAASLLRAGHRVVVFDQSRAQMDALASLGATLADGPGVACSGVATVLLSLPGSQEVEEVLFGPGGAVEAQVLPRLVVDLSTVSPAAARRVAARLAERGIAFLDAPVSGGPARAASGTLTIMVGGEATDLESARPVLSAIGSTIFHAGPIGSGQVVKACNNLLIGTIMAGNAEALALAVSAGIPAERAREIILAGTAANWQLEHIAPRTILTGDYSPIFALRLLRKDLGIAAELARENSLPLLVGSHVRELYALADALEPGGDFSSVARLYELALGRPIAGLGPGGAEGVA